ncbi:MAG: RNA polymerase sigma factor [Flavobacterium sp.]|nr:MAG: RNA polymerase sigma factor [Flavobacterium sp.]
MINGIRNGSKSAIDQLYKMYSSSLYGIIRRIVKFDEVAEDVLQDTFVKIWKSISQYDSTKGRLFTWMANLAKNTAIDQIRSKYYTNAIKTDTICNIQVNVIDQQKHFILNSDGVGVKQLMYDLKPDQRAIMELFYFQGYTQTEVSEALQIPLGTVKTKIRQAILQLRRYFNETNDLVSIGA